MLSVKDVKSVIRHHLVVYLVIAFIIALGVWIVFTKDPTLVELGMPWVYLIPVLVGVTWPIWFVATSWLMEQVWGWIYNSVGD